MRVANWVVSNRLMSPMPLSPRSTVSHAEATVLPTGETMPRPVTTTRRLLMEASPQERIGKDAIKRRGRRSADPGVGVERLRPCGAP